jgi:dihydroneopterin aldolase
VKYSGIYKDSSGSTNIIIENNFENLSVEIDGVKFIGTEFSDFSIPETLNYSQKQLERFTFSGVAVYGAKTLKKSLCNCSFNITIPQIIINSETNQNFEINVNLNYTLGNENPINKGLDYENMILSFRMERKEYVGESGYIETVFEQIQEQLGESYSFKNCFSCMYGDYSVYGQSAFGSMRCYVNQKEQYMKVKTKMDYLSLLNDVYKKVQEIYYCPNFKIRKKGFGYRG